MCLGVPGRIVAVEQHPRRIDYFPFALLPVLREQGQVGVDGRHLAEPGRRSVVNRSPDGSYIRTDIPITSRLRGPSRNSLRATHPALLKLFTLLRDACNPQCSSENRLPGCRWLKGSISKVGSSGLHVN